MFAGRRVWLLMKPQVCKNGSDGTVNKIEMTKTHYSAEAVDPRFQIGLQGRIYNFLERPSNWKCFAYHCSVFLLVVICLVFSILSTIDQHKKLAHAALFYLEIILVVFFGLEYVVRLWAVGCRSKFMGCGGRLRFMKRPIIIIDLSVVLASVAVITLGLDAHIFATSAIRGIRFLQILRMLHVDRKGGTWKLLGSVVYLHRQTGFIEELVTTLYIGFLCLIFSSYFVYLAEQDTLASDGTVQFSSYADALWWGVITMTTIGYGDTVPQTWVGRLVACLFAIIAISFFALPAGILGSGFALQVQQKQRRKHLDRQIPAAATLIQRTWRCFAATKDLNSGATWKKHLAAFNYYRTTSVSSSHSISGAEGLESIYRKVSRKIGASASPKKSQDNEESVSGECPTPQLQNQRMSSKTLYFPSVNLFRHRSETEQTCDSIAQPIFFLTEDTKNAIRLIRKIQYFVARKKFQESCKPYDVRDVIEQSSKGHLNMLHTIMEMQRRLDQTVGKSKHHAEQKTTPAYSVTITARITRVELQLNSMDRKLDACIEKMKRAISVAPGLHKTAALKSLALE